MTLKYQANHPSIKATMEKRQVTYDFYRCQCFASYNYHIMQSHSVTQNDMTR